MRSHAYYPAVTAAHRIRLIVATTLALGLVGFAFHFPGSSEVGSGLDEWQPGAATFGFVLGSLSGVVVGIAQWLSLRPAVARPWPLVLPMIIGIGVTHALFDGMPTSAGRAAMALLGGIALAFALGIATLDRRRVAVVTWMVAWPAGIVLGYAVTGALGLPATADPLGWATEHAIVGAVTGLVWGTAAALVGLMLTRRKTQTV